MAFTDRRRPAEFMDARTIAARDLLARKMQRRASDHQPPPASDATWRKRCTWHVRQDAKFSEMFRAAQRRMIGA